MMPMNSYNRDDDTKTAVDRLETLLDKIYPDPSPDIFTLTDFTNRYPLTGLGDLAIREIEQSVRINNSLNNYTQIGLCEFHIGLIYLFWGDFRGAMTQFNSARKKWGFAGAGTTASLCFLAEGYANYLALHYEEALRCYGLAERAVARINSKRNEFYYNEIVAYIQEAHEDAREAIWQRMRAKPSTAETKESTDDTEDAPPSETASEPINRMTTPPPESQVRPTSQIVDPAPANNIAADSKENHAVAAPMFKTHLPVTIDVPFPGHLQSDPNYVWYQVENRSDNILYHDLCEGDWLLVNTQPIAGINVQAEESLLVIMDEDIDNAIHIRPDRVTGPYHRIYLATCKNLVGSFKKDPESGEITFTNVNVTFSSPDQQISVQWSAILGIVVGFWRNKPNGIAPINFDGQNSS